MCLGLNYLFICLSPSYAWLNQHMLVMLIHVCELGAIGGTTISIFFCVVVMLVGSYFY